MKRQSVPLPAWLPENALKPRIAATGVNSISARLEVDAVSAVFVPDPEVDLFLAQGSVSNPRVFARLLIGEGARPRAPRGRALIQRCILVRDQDTSSTSATADREDAIPPRRWGRTHSEEGASGEPIRGLSFLGLRKGV